MSYLDDVDSNINAHMALRDKEKTPVERANAAISLLSTLRPQEFVIAVVYSEPTREVIEKVLKKLIDHTDAYKYLCSLMLNAPGNEMKRWILPYLERVISRKHLKTGFAFMEARQYGIKDAKRFMQARRQTYL